MSALEQPRWGTMGRTRGPRVSHGAALLGAVGRTTWPRVSRAGLLGTVRAGPWIRVSPEQPHWGAVGRTVWIPCQPGAAPTGCRGQDRVDPVSALGAAPLGVGQDRVDPVSAPEQPYWAPWAGPRGPMSARSRPAPGCSGLCPRPRTTAGLSLGTLDCGPSNLVFLSK